jgi:two-component system CheB/CheR fusion protein
VAKKQAGRAPRHRKKATRATAARKADRATKPTVSGRAVTRHLIVGIGASAGGLEAFTQLLRRLPADTGMAFVLVQHLDPNRESALTDLLSRVTSLPVREVTKDLPVEPNHIYVIPPNSNLSIANSVLKLQPRQLTAGAHRSIDFFFESLAQDQRERAIGVILSGTATDGTLGLEAIKAEGGITFAQDDTAQYASMPRSAVSAGCVDFVLDPEDIAKELIRIAKHPYVAGHHDPESLPEADRAFATAHENDGTPLPSGGHGIPRTRSRQSRAEGEAEHGNAGDNGFKKILLLLRNHCGVDFSLYKSATIQRRVTRRMVLNRHDTLSEYASFLKGNAKELDALYSDVLISVTSFFRNPEAFDILKRKIFPKLLQQRGDDPCRVWVLGCSTGQEAYSIAMTFVETAEKAPRMRKLQVFATDLNDALLEKARHGLYAKSLAQDVSPERLRRFFVEEEGGYRINKALREMVVFARQNLMSDPPFSRMDLVSCRNLMIYLETGLQKKLIPTFHYALKPDGFLFLGTSESVGSFTDLFEPADRKHKIYSRKAAPTPSFHLPVRKELAERRSPGQPRQGGPRPAERGQAGPEGFRSELNSQREADRITVNKYAPPGVLVNADLQVLQFRGPTSAYLEPPTGKASFDVLKMAREGLMLPLHAAIKRAKKENKPTRKENVRIRENGDTRMVNVEVIPLKSLKERSFLILFDDAEKGRAFPGIASREQPRGVTRTLRPVGKKEESRRIAAMERDLSETRDYLQSIQEQHEATNEELQASNEEIQSANEELQSVNEELETSKEELESANEELNTVNEEMANRNVELNRLNSDLTNLQTSTRLAIVLFGRDLTIRRFSPQAEKQFNLIATDIGRPIGEVQHNLDLTDLETFIAEVIASIRERECEVRDKDGRWYSLRVRPYLTIDNKVDGAVLVLVDIDALKRTELEIIKASEYSDAIIRTVPEPLVILDSGLRVQSANEAFYDTFKLSPVETERRSLLDLDHGTWKIPELQQLLKGIIPSNSFFDDLQVTLEFERIGRRTMLLNARPLHQTDDKIKLILLGIRDVTELMHFRGAARESEARYRALFEAIDEGFCIIEKVEAKPGALNDFRYLVANPAFETQTGVGDIVGKTIREAFPSEPQEWCDTYDAILRTGEAIRFERDLVPQGRVLELYAFRVEDETRRRVAVLFADITERKRAEQRLLLLKNELAHRGKNLLAVIQSIASRSLSGTRSLPEAREVFTQRIHALARSQSALMTGGFEGASIAEIIRLEFEAFSNQIKAVGPNLMLNPKIAQTFALLVHELATNASKYGALSRPEGQVAIHWSIAGEGADARFKFQWQERDGPPIVPPTHQGFGSTLLEKAAAQDFGARPKISFAPTGLTYEIDAPLSLVTADGTGSDSL